MKDKVEKEPFSLLLSLFGAGALSFFAVHYVEIFITGLFDKIFEEYRFFSPEGILTYSSTAAETTHNLLCAFLGFSLIEIVVKWLILYVFTHKNPNFNYLFDGIVYSVFISLGFAAIENLWFAWENGWNTLGLKIISSLPGHLFVGILMGYYYTMWRVRYKANVIENKMLEKGIVEKDNIRSSAIWLISGIVIPFLIYGLYCMLSFGGSEIITTAFYFLTFLLYGFCFISIDQIADKDCESKRYICKIISKGHHGLSNQVIEELVDQNELGGESK
jgi:RsiW-degrading membrane proteinase PrsW (M82 family)